MVKGITNDSKSLSNFSEVHSDQNNGILLIGKKSHICLSQLLKNIIHNMKKESFSVVMQP